MKIIGKRSLHGEAEGSTVGGGLYHVLSRRVIGMEGVKDPDGRSDDKKQRGEGIQARCLRRDWGALSQPRREQVQKRKERGNDKNKKEGQVRN